jgi:hypothetical protein
LFCYDNPPGTKEISGSQDAIGLVFPGLNISHYRGEYWPWKIEPAQNEDVLSFIERSLYLVPLGPRGPEFSVLTNTHITRQGAKALAEGFELLGRDSGAGRGRFWRFHAPWLEAQSPCSSTWSFRLCAS